MDHNMLTVFRVLMTRKPWLEICNGWLRICAHSYPGSTSRELLNSLSMQHTWNCISLSLSCRPYDDLHGLCG